MGKVRKIDEMSDHITNTFEMLKKKKTIDVRSPKKRRFFSDEDPHRPEFRIQKSIEDVSSDDENLQLEATKHLCRLLAIEHNTPPIGQVIQSGVVPRIVSFLQRSDVPTLQFHAAWVLTNIASGTTQQTQAVIDSGAVPLLVDLLQSPDVDVCEQAIWALGNISGESRECRDFVLRHDALIPLHSLLDGRPLHMMEKATWTLRNFVRFYPRPAHKHNQIQAVIVDLQRLIKSSDKEILAEACLALSFLSVGSDDEYQDLIKADVLPRLLELLNYPSHSVISPALRTLVNIVRFGKQGVSRGELVSHVISGKIIHDGGLVPLRNMLIGDYYTTNMKKEACWVLSRIMAGNTLHIRIVIKAKIVAPLVWLLKSSEHCIRKEAALALKFVAVSGNNDQIRHLVDEGCIEPVCKLLMSYDFEVVIDCLVVIGKILEVGDYNMWKLMARVEAWIYISSLTNHDDIRIQDYAKDLLLIKY